MKTIKAAIEANTGVTPILHSDRGFQYTSKEYIREVSKAGITRSMSRVGRCIDNAPMESFWSHFKDEYYYDHTFITYEELVSGIAGYINYYNNERYQWKLKSLPPVEYRNQAAQNFTYLIVYLTGVTPNWLTCNIKSHLQRPSLHWQNASQILLPVKRLSEAWQASAKWTRPLTA